MTKSATKSAIYNASKGAQSIWNAVKSSASQISSIITNSSHLSDTSEENLADLSEMVGTLFNNSNAQHVELLEQLFKALFPGNTSFAHLLMLSPSHYLIQVNHITDTVKFGNMQDFKRMTPLWTLRRLAF